MASLERMRAKQAQLHKTMGAAGKAPEPPPPAAPKPPEKTKAGPVKEKKQAGAKVKYRCGHEQAETAFGGQDCPACRDDLRRARNARRRARREAKKGPPTDSPRLPDGATFHVAYDATAERWSGELTIPDRAAGRPAAVFTDDSSGVFRLLQKLDGQYRAFVKASQRPA